MSTARIIAVALAAAAVTAADPEARYALWPLHDHERPATTVSSDGQGRSPTGG